MDLHDVSPLLEDVSHPNGNWPTNKSFCLEWEFEAQPDRITVWVDGNKIGTFDNTNATSPSGNGAQNGQLYMGTSTGLIGGFDLFYIGFHDWHPAKVFDLYYDDVVLDAKRDRLSCRRSLRRVSAPRGLQGYGLESSVTASIAAPDRSGRPRRRRSADRRGPNACRRSSAAPRLATAPRCYG